MVPPTYGIWCGGTSIIAYTHISFFISTMKKIPEKFNVHSSSYSKIDVQAALQRDGSVILTNLVDVPVSEEGGEKIDWQATASHVPHLVWDESDLLLGHGHKADPVHKEHAQLSLAGAALLPHTDGYIWGDHFPDVVILVCESPASTIDGSTTGTPGKEGANYLIDGLQVVNQLDEATRKLLHDELVDHTERGDDSFCLGVESIVPVIRWLQPRGWWQRHQEPTKEGHLCWRRMVGKTYAGQDAAGVALPDAKTGNIPYISLWATIQNEKDESHQKDVQAALHAVDRAISHVAVHDAARFTLGRGEAMIVDNFRLLHAREAFAGLDQQRRMWRVWAWTSASFGLPPALKMATAATTASNQEAVAPPANILDAQHSIQVHKQLQEQESAA
jgi:alpha-ketoglutarate-dependent taurine dioxygenase